MPARPSFRQLKGAVTVERVLADRGLLGGLRRRGDDLVGPCPLHGGDNPGAFVVSRSKGLWYCFTGCGRGGDVVELVRRLDGPSHADAGRYLQALAGADIETSVHLAAGEDAAASPVLAGFCPFTRRLPLDAATPFLTAKGISVATASRFEAGAWHGGGFLAGCVAVRLHDLDGRPLGYAGRRMDASMAKTAGKWKLPPRLPKAALLYGWHRVAGSPAEGLVVVEGPWAVMRLAQLGLSAVALLGARASEQQCALLATTDRVVVMLDGDAAGREGARRLGCLLGDRVDLRVFELPGGADPDDLDDLRLRAVRGLLSL